MDDARDTDGLSAIWTERRLRLASEAAGLALWSWDVDTDIVTMDSRAFEIWGVPKGTITFSDLSASIHPEDRDRVRKALLVAWTKGVPYEIDFRISCFQEVRCISARGRRDHQGAGGRILFGVFLDLSAHKRAEEDREAVIQQIRHRIQNLFTLATSLTLIASRNAATKEALVDDLSRRLRGLSAAYTLMLPAFDDQKRVVTLKDLIEALLNAYRTDVKGQQSVQISACEVEVGERSITPIAMLVHDLATTSAQCRALSTEGGRIDIRFMEVADKVKVVWAERGFVPGQHPVAAGGDMMERVLRQVSGSVKQDWSDKDLIITLELRKSSLKD